MQYKIQLETIFTQKDAAYKKKIGSFVTASSLKKNTKLLLGHFGPTDKV